MQLRAIKPNNLNPASGLSTLIHLGLQALLPLAMFVLVRAAFVEVALALVILSKWRMFAVQPRFWLANIRANAVDITFGIAMLVLMTQADSAWLQLVWTVVYAVWLIYVKPLHGFIGTSIQAGLGEFAGLTAIFLAWGGGPLYGLVALVGVVAYLCGRHFFDSFDEPYARLYSATWAYFSAALMWVLGHWLLFYGPIAQPTLLLSVLGYGAASLYYLDHHERLSHLLRRQVIGVMVVVVAIVLLLSDWGNKVV